MIFLSPDAAEDVERLRTFLDSNGPEAAKRALATIWKALERLHEFPDLGAPTSDADIRQMTIRFGNYGYIARLHRKHRYRRHPGDPHLARPRSTRIDRRMG
jgi:toxin ParE1/3/4